MRWSVKWTGWSHGAWTRAPPELVGTLVKTARVEMSRRAQASTAGPRLPLLLVSTAIRSLNAPAPG